MTKRKNPRKGAEAFFYEHAGYGYDPKTETKEEGRRRGAKLLADAEQWAWDNNYEFLWEEDPEGWDLLGDVDPDDVSEVLVVRMVDAQGETVQSLGGVLMGHNSVDNRNMGRVFEAELASEEYPGRSSNPTSSTKKLKAKLLK